MKIEVGHTAGFCGGVTNSVTNTEKLLQEYGRVNCLGELVHNKEVIAKLTKKGLNTINNLDEAENNSNVIIRAHGITKEVYEMAKKRNINLIDLTCPKVLKIHEKIEEYKNADYFIILVGVKTHPETIGSFSFCGNKSIILEDISALDEVINFIKNNDYRNVVVFSQTTYSVKEFAKIVSKLQENLECNLKIENTICGATNSRQEECRKMSLEKDCMIIIGGKNSSNTKKLFEVASENCKKCFLIETVNDLEINEVKKYSNIGIMAGASTPKDSIDEVLNVLKRDSITI